MLNTGLMSGKKIVKEYQKKLDYIDVDGYYLDTIDTFYYFENNEN